MRAGQYRGNTFERLFDYNKRMKRVYDWAQIQQFHDAGNSFTQCQRRFGFSHTAWVKAIRRKEISVRFRAIKRPSTLQDRRRVYDWPEVQRYYDEGHTYRECREKFGFAAETWHKAKRRGEIIARPREMPLDELIARRRSRNHLKSRLFRAGLVRNECEVCGITEWRGQRLAMHLDHINGMRDDNRLENLRLLCPNCHSQTSTYGGRNVRRLRLLQEESGVS